MSKTEQLVRECMQAAGSRTDFWIQFLNLMQVNDFVELGVYKGDFAEKILKQCTSIRQYYMIDPWRHLEQWNKPANQENDIFERYMSEAMAKTDFAADRRIVLRGKTTDVAHKIPDNTLDFAYIDGDHTLRGIAIDLIQLYPKVKNGGWIGGDDFSENVWQAPSKFEPTLVFPFAIYFAEAVNARIYALPNEQFLIEKNSEQSFALIDLTDTFTDIDIGLRRQFNPDRLEKLKWRDRVSLIWAGPRRIKQLLIKLKYKI